MYLTVTFSTDNATFRNDAKQLFSVSSNYNNR